jgi:hypothetical protein
MPTPSLVLIPSGVSTGKIFGQIPYPAYAWDVVRNSVAYRVTNDDILEEVAAHVARLSYRYGGKINGCPALLCEASGTNLFRDSEPATDPGQGNRLRVTFGANTMGIGLEGSCFHDTEVGFTQYYNAGDLSSGDYTLCCIAKNSDLSPVTYNAAETGIRFRLGNVTVSGGSATRIGDTNLYFIVAQGNLTSSSNLNGLRKDFGGGAIITETSAIMVLSGHVTPSISSYIKTTGAAASRNADVINLTSVSSKIGQVEGYLFADVQLDNTDTSQVKTILGISDGTIDNRISIRRTTDNRIQLIVDNATARTVDIQTAANQFGRFRIVVSYETDNASLYVNGTLVGTDTSTAIPACSAAYAGKIEDSTDANFLNDHIARAEVGMNKLTPAEIEELSSWNSYNELALALNYTL